MINRHRIVIWMFSFLAYYSAASYALIYKSGANENEENINNSYYNNDVIWRIFQNGKIVKKQNRNIFYNFNFEIPIVIKLNLVNGKKLNNKEVGFVLNYNSISNLNRNSNSEYIYINRIKTDKKNVKFNITSNNKIKFKEYIDFHNNLRISRTSTGALIRDYHTEIRTPNGIKSTLDIVRSIVSVNTTSEKNAQSFIRSSLIILFNSHNNDEFSIHIDKFLGNPKNVYISIFPINFPNDINVQEVYIDLRR